MDHIPMSRDRAFNLGCDARIAGVPLGHNPFSRAIEDLNFQRCWTEGWYHVSVFWGIDNKDRPILHLPRVEGTAA